MPSPTPAYGRLLPVDTGYYRLQCHLDERFIFVDRKQGALDIAAHLVRSALPGVVQGELIFDDLVKQGRGVGLSLASHFPP